jgi:hypothetical protein
MLNASRCDVACQGNGSEVCGGSLALTLYNLTDKSATKSMGASLLKNDVAEGMWFVVGLGVTSFVFVIVL